MACNALTCRQVDIRILNTNTGRVLVETVAVDEEGYFLERGDYRIAGVLEPGTEIKVAFVDPAGSMTGRLLPTGNTEDTITVETPTAFSESFSVQATLIDAANPFVIVDAESLSLPFVQGSKEWLETIEDIRRKGAVMMGLAETIHHAASTRGTPKIMMVSSPHGSESQGKLHPMPDISVLSLSMGQIHPSVQLTGAVCLATAVCVEGTVAYRARKSINLPRSLVLGSAENQLQDLHSSQRPETILIAHRSGQIPVQVHLQGQDGVDKCVVSRTARRLFEGNVLFYT